MKILRVEIQGFGPFPNQEVIDFESFASDGKFVITGRTGAGKSSILDAITFALFGHVPRYGSVVDATVRSDFLRDSDDPTEVSVEFVTDSGRYRVTRRPSFIPPGRKTARAQHAEIAQWKSDSWEVLASRKVKEVGTKIGEIVGLSAEQFQQVILLAQGQFQEFLVADSNERRKLLRKLFDTGRFLDYSEDLDERARNLRQDLELTHQAIKTNVGNLASAAGQHVPDDLEASNGARVLEWADPLVESQNQLLLQATADAEEKEVAANAAEASWNQAKATAEAQKRLAQAHTQQAALVAAAPGIEAERTRLEVARRADRVWPTVQAHSAAARALQSAQDGYAAAQVRFREHHGDADQAPDAVERLQEDLQAFITRLEDAAATEERLPDIRSKSQSSATTLAALLEQIESGKAQRAQSQQQVNDLDEKIASLLSRVQQEPTAKAAVEALSSRLKAAQSAEIVRANLSTAQSEAQTKAAQAASADAHLEELRERQLAGYAGTLAAALIDGSPCSVCGSREHPDKASVTEDQISPEEIEEAKHKAADSHTSSAQAKSNVATLLERLSGLEQSAAGGTVEGLTEELRQVEATLAEIQGAATEKESLDQQREAVHQQIVELGQQIESSQSTLGAKEAAAAVSAADLKRSEDKVHEARGEATSVAQRLLQARDGLASAQALRTAAAAVGQATNDLHQRTAEQSKSLAANGFDDSEAVIAARMVDAEQEQIAARVKEHDGAVAVVTATLADPQLQDLPDEPVDVEGPASLARTAAQDHRDAVEQLGQVKRQFTQVKKLRDDIHASLDEAGDKQREYDVVNRLALTVKGQTPNTKKMTLETFALAADLEDIVTAANTLLGKMTANRYELRYSDELAKGGAQSGLAIEVIDAYNGETRAPASLSGGEKFQASLALALGLAEVVTSRNGGINLDTLFIDEGFGTLDQETLEITLDTVDSLREGGRMVGLISHVGEVKERIPHHIHVRVTDEGWSTLGTLAAPAG